MERMKGTKSDIFDSSADQTVTFGGAGVNMTPDQSARLKRVRPLFLESPDPRPTNSTMLSETLTSTMTVETRSTSTVQSGDCGQNLQSLRPICPEPGLHLPHHHHVPAVILQTHQCGGLPVMPCGVQALQPSQLCREGEMRPEAESNPTQEEARRGNGPGGSYRPWRKMSRKPAKRYQSSTSIRPARDARVSENMLRTGLSKLTEKDVDLRRARARAIKADRDGADETVKEKLERKVGLMRKPWERLELGGQAPPSSSEDEELGHITPSKFTRSLMDLSPGYIEDDKDDQEVEEGKAKRKKK